MANAKIVIEVDEKEFLKKTVKEQNLDLMKALAHIHTHGCEFASTVKRRNFAVSAASGLAGGFLAVVGKMAIWREL